MSEQIITQEQEQVEAKPDPKPSQRKRPSAKPKTSETRSATAETKKHTIPADYTKAVIAGVEKGRKYSEIEKAFDAAKRKVPTGFKTHYPAIRKASLDHYGSVGKVNEIRAKAK